MIDSKKFRAFRKYNKLTQDDVAIFLGTKKAFISQIETGRVSLPEDKLFMLLRNDRGWDVSLLKEEDNTEKPNKDSADKQGLSSSLDLALNEIVEQRKLTAKSQEQIDRLLGIIEGFQNSQK